MGKFQADQMLLVRMAGRKSDGGGIPLIGLGLRVPVKDDSLLHQELLKLLVLCFP